MAASPVSVIVVHHQEAPYFEELLPSISSAFSCCSFAAPSHSLPDSALWVGFAAIRCCVEAPLIRARYHLFNTEQLSRRCKLEELSNLISLLPKDAAICVYDYSLENIRLLRTESGNVAAFRHVPFDPVPSDVAALQALMRTSTKLYDFAVVGSPSVHRALVVDRFTKAGFSVCCVTGFGAVRDKQVAQCKALLNIHFSGDYTIYEQSRCSRWSAAGMIIVSEPCDDLPRGPLLVIN